MDRRIIMALEKLIIGDIIKLNENHLALGLTFADLEVSSTYRDKSIHEVKNEFFGKTILISNNEPSKKIEIIDVEVSSSIIEFKNIFLIVERSIITEELKEADTIEIDLS